MAFLMRKMVYYKRHLAQEKAKQDTDSKGYRSLKIGATMARRLRCWLHKKRTFFYCML